MAASGAASLAAQYSPPIASKATAADTTSNYWSTTNGASTAAHYKGATLGQVQYEINKAGLQLAPTAAAPFVPASERQPIKAPNGSMRPRDEHAPTMTRMLGLTTFSPQTNPSNANTTPAYGAAFDRLMTSLRAADAKGSGSGKLLPTDIFRICETTHLPLDDREVRAAIRKCVPDAHGKIGIEQFVQTLKMRWTPSEPKPSKGGERIWELQGGPEPITKMLRPVLPAHAYKASDLPPSPTKKVAKWNDNQEEAQPWHCRNAYEMLTAGAQPQAPHPAEMQRRLLADPNRSGDDQLNALRLALQQYDRTHCGVLPATTVTQYAQLHRINKAHSPAWESILFSCEAPGMRGRIDYRKLLEKLQNK